MPIIRTGVAVAALTLTLAACGGTAATQAPGTLTPTDRPAQTDAPPPAETSPPTEAPEPTATSAPTDAPEPTDASAPATARARIVDSSFSPGAVEVAVGGEVVWTHEGDLPHTVTFADDGPDSGTLSGGDTFRHTFDTAGEFSYVCGIHPSMRGTVTVTE